MVDDDLEHSSLPIPNIVRDVEVCINAGLANTVQEQMSKVPALGRYVVEQMKGALSLSERILIAETALIVYKAMYDPKSDSSHINDVYIMVVEDEGKFPGKQDKNKIYIDIQNDMANHPELALFITNQMKFSVSLEEANLVGETALVVYKTLKADEAETA